MRTVFAATFGLILATVLPATSPTDCRAEDWLQFRGANGGVTSGSLPTAWGPATNVKWKVKVPGVAWSAPIVLGDTVFVTTAITENQKKPGGYTPRGGPGGGDRGGRGGGGGRPRFTPPRPGEVLPSFFHGMLNLTDEQKEELSKLQKQVDDQLVKLLSDEQQKQFQGGPQAGDGPGRGGPGGRRRFRPPTPGVVIPDSTQADLKLTDDQKEFLARIQKAVDGKLPKLLNEEQNKQVTDMRHGRRRGGPGGFGGERKPPEDVYRWEVHSIDLNTGKTNWKKLALESRPRIPTQSSNTYATETPVSDGERIYAYFAMHGLFCYDLAGELVWKKDLGSYPMAAGWGTASSPVLDGDRLFVLCDNEKESFIVALDKMSGDELWRTPRSEKTSYASPFVWRNKSRTEIIALGSPKVRSYDPASGKQLWELTIGNGRCSASPVGNAEMLFVGLDGSRADREGGGGNAGGMFAVRPGASGNLDDDSSNGVAWNSRQDGPPMASPLVYDGHVYIFSHNGGIVSCLNAETGERVYRKRLPGAKSFWSSPWAGDGKVFCLDDSGTTYVLKSGPKYELLGQNKLEEMTWASTAAADGSIFVRSVDHLYRIAE